MAGQQRSNWRLRGGHYLGEISALCFLHLPTHLSSFPFLLAGTGSQLLLYNLGAGKMIKSFQVFQGIRVHGIVSGFADLKERSSSTILEFEVAVFGEKRVNLFILSIETVLGSHGELQVGVDLSLFHSLPRFSHWVLDVCFLKESRCLAIGCSSNSVCIWDISKYSVVLEVQSPERCLLYSMRFWGDNLETLRIASGTIYNEIIVWKLVLENDAKSLTSSLEHEMYSGNTLSNSTQLELQQHKAAHISRLVGHEGSIFRMAWSSDGSILVSVSDDRSARIWSINTGHGDSKNCDEATGPVLYGHNARVWDCCVSSSLIFTAGEDCTCQVWGLDGRQVKVIKEHIGRGVWRCLYDPRSSFLLTAGFDSAIKVHQLHASLPWTLEGESRTKQLTDGLKILHCRIPNSCEHSGLMDSKSEYVRCLRFGSEDTLYVATNHGCLYHASFSQTQNVKWTKIVQVSEEVQIICMDLMSKRLPKQSGGIDDWIALGDGKGYMTVVRVMGDVYTPEVDITCTWPAEKERQLLGIYWCNASEYSFIFTADPRGTLKLWKLYDPLPSASHTSARAFNMSLLAEFTSSYGIRIKCLEPSFEDQVLICGDIRGNLILFPLSKDLFLDASNIQKMKISPQSYFKGAHGISSVSSITIAELSFNEIKICSVCDKLQHVSCEI
uniref:Uncharacterized protein MANES_05G010600 n=1 Tax=Rhizophora mucronata TaxID=61149 RepID=A0A2P2JEE0_RHIMU